MADEQAEGQRRQQRDALRLCYADTFFEEDRPGYAVQHLRGGNEDEEADDVHDECRLFISCRNALSK